VEKANGAAGPLIVGVGASAGGLEALRAILRAIPAGQGIAIVVVFHLDPGSKGLLAEALASATSLPVVEAADGTRVEADRIYIAPGHATVAMARGVIRVAPAERREERMAPVDRFLQSLARDQRERAVAVILSGSGSDGALGVKAVAESGGLTLVQAPETARHEGMPQSALATGAADHALAPEDLASELLAYARHIRGSAAAGPDALRVEVAEALPTICDLLLDATGHNFRHYKTSTRVRRVIRRIQILRLGGASDYIKQLRVDRSEAESLFDDLLIGVTAFFRDPEAFEALARDAIPRLFEGRRDDDPIRVWVPGCATGEEVYTLAILFREEFDRRGSGPKVQIFGTDLDEDALAAARQGSYPIGIADEVSPERLKKYFVKKAQQYHVTREIREFCLFSFHNLINDPPFSKLDLISCRNLLIYLGSHLQQKLIPLFHYALRPEGYLFLGPSEGLSTHRELFRPIDPKHRISQRLPTAIRSSVPLTGRSGPLSTVRPPNVGASGDTETYLIMQRIVLDEFAPKAAVIDDDGQILCASGNLEKYLAVSAGVFQNNIIRLAREGLRLGLRSALAEASRDMRKVESDGLALQTESGVQRVMVTVQPMPQLGGDSGLFLVVFNDVGLPLSREEGAAPAIVQDATAVVEQLERELANARKDLEQTVQDLEAANEELKSSNEELLSMNEELQSANEELETSKEDVQAANESLSRLNTDLENLLASTQIATIFLDEAGKIRRVTPTLAEIYNIQPRDAGRPLSHFTHRMRQMPPMPGLEAIYRAERPIEDEAESLDGRWYLRRALPYRTREGEPAGVVVTFTDVTGRKRAEEALRETDRLKDEFLATLAHELRNPLAPLRTGLHLLPTADRNDRNRTLEMMDRQLRHLVHLVDDLLDVSRITRGLVVLRPERVDIRAIIEAALDLSRPLIEAAGHKLAVRIPDEPFPLDADPTRLAQVIGNLLANAARYTDPGGKIDLEARRDGADLVIAVSDDGIGIPPDMLERIFNIFIRVPHPQERAIGGLGIGLTLVRRLVELHAGSATAESDGLGKGSRFIVRLPLALDVPAEPEATEAPAGEAGSASRRIVIADDNLDGAESLAMLLRVWGHEVWTAHTGPDALKVVRDIRPRVLFLDIGLPGMSGYDVARALREELGGAGRTILVALTGWGSERDRERSREAGFDHHLTKPVDPGKILAILEGLS
jgi:two-component system CheB/CheR fusion protein